MKMRIVVKSCPWEIPCRRLLTEFVYVLTVYDATKVAARRPKPERLKIKRRTLNILRMSLVPLSRFIAIIVLSRKHNKDF